MFNQKKNEKKSIVLIGMPGVGKSTIGVILAKEIGYQFVDADLLIQQQEGMLLREIIEKKGHDGFLSVENQVNRDIDAPKSVIATGGSAVYCKEAMEHYKETCCVVYLRCPYQVLEKRLGDLKGRGVALKEGQTLWDLYEERSVLYEKYADLIIDEDEKGIEETLEILKSGLENL
ncbi:MAG: shikimate kinase [Lachnospiraceae bacterium]|nr:shikimate kinase [Lachnospiraceae bacterium]MDD7210681.1 shikimate kinase [Lachnospiraceae bacterium]MDY5497641.1 shikimate kinase [Anaerobutyricum sp.]